MSRLVVTGMLAAILGMASPAHPAPARRPLPRTESGGPQRLMEAYQREFGFLAAQKRALAERLLRVKREGASRIAQGKAEVDALQAQVIMLRSQAENLAETLREVTRKADPGEEEDRVAEVIDRARGSLGKLGFQIQLPPKGDKARRITALKTIFQRAVQAVDRGHQVRSEKGTFFLPGGEQVEGTLIHVGGVATYGVSGKTAGALAPAGQGRLKLWPQAAAATARALARGERPGTLRLFLYETLDKNVEPKAKKSFLEEVRAGGKIAWVIVGLGAAAFLLIFLRIGILAWVGLGTGRLLQRLGPLVRAGRLEDALERTRKSFGAAGRVLSATLEHPGRDREVLEDAASEALLKEVPRLDRFGAAITVFAAVAPLLGLLGTVTGMIATFDVITEHGTGDPKLLAGGISEALITTKLGLLVAIPTLLVGTLLRGWSETIQVHLERAALHVVNLLKGEPAGPTAPADGGTDGGETVEVAPETVRSEAGRTPQERVAGSESPEPPEPVRGVGDLAGERA